MKQGSRFRTTTLVSSSVQLAVKDEGEERSPPERPTSCEDIGFLRQTKMVQWLHPRFLLKAGAEVVLSDLFGSYADKREVEAGLPWALRPIEPESLERDADGRPEDSPSDYVGKRYRDVKGALWFDYAADVGEGFDPTYTVAWLLAQPILDVGKEQIPTERGRFLVLGGDQVYPAASWHAYRDRFVGPYRCALPHVPGKKAPDLYAIPGNHDWYDGLTSFMRLLCQGGWIGGWRTRQRRSYFALKLPQGWWLFATDIQLDKYMDGPQLDYFRAIDLREGDRVVLVTAKPSWLDANGETKTIMREGSWETLRFFEQEIGARGAKVAVTITGDKHHFAHYEKEGAGDPQHRITAGGGGAHTTGTNSLPERLDARPEKAKDPFIYELCATFPTPPESEALREGVPDAVTRVRALGWLIGGIWGLLALAIAAGQLLLSVALAAGLGYGLRRFFEARGGDKASLPARRIAWAHSLAQILIPASLTAGGLLLAPAVGISRDHALTPWGVAGLVGVVGSVLGLRLFGRYLYEVNKKDPNVHSTEVYGALTSEMYKCFLRFRLGPGGDLTIYPVGICQCPKWDLDLETNDPCAPWFRPMDPSQMPVTKVIGRPIQISGRRGPSAGVSMLDDHGDSGESVT